MAQFRVDKRDFEFVLFEQYGVDRFGERFERYAGMDREMLSTMLEEAIRFMGNELAPTLESAEKEGCKVVDGQVLVPQSYVALYKKYAENGWLAVAQNTEHGGMGLPFPMGIAVSELAIAASSSFMFYPGLTVSAGHLIENFANKELRDLLVPKLYGGQWAGTMCLTEPSAGSAVGDLKTTATPIEGSPNEYLIKGQKIFISAGDHQLTENIIHLVLARVPGDAPGTKGISLFIVPKKRFDAAGNLLGDNDVAVAGIEHKMGITASSTCSLSFGDNDQCRGYLVGERCQGIVYMFQMMNEARIICGVQGVALGGAAYQAALAYAKERTQGPKVTDRTPNPKSVAIIEHPDVRRNLMISKAYIEGMRALLIYTAALADEAHNGTDEAAKTKAADLVDLLTPICKAYSTDKGFKVTELAIQIHGGYGYIREYNVEQYMRDVKIASLYEGTNGIQALDLLGRKMRLKGGGLFLTWLQDTNELLEAHASHEALAEVVAQLDKAKNTICELAFGFSETAKKDPELSILGATPFLEAFGHVEIARLLLHQAVIAHDKLKGILAAQGATSAEQVKEVVTNHADARFYDGKVKTARFFASSILPQVHALAREVKAGDRSALDIVF